MNGVHSIHLLDTATGIGGTHVRGNGASAADSPEGDQVPHVSMWGLGSEESLPSTGTLIRLVLCQGHKHKQKQRKEARFLPRLKSGRGRKCNDDARESERSRADPAPNRSGVQCSEAWINGPVHRGVETQLHHCQDGKYRGALWTPRAAGRRGESDAPCPRSLRAPSVKTTLLKRHVWAQHRIRERQQLWQFALFLYKGFGASCPPRRFRFYPAFRE